jgi:hypothetical protein
MLHHYLASEIRKFVVFDSILVEDVTANGVSRHFLSSTILPAISSTLAVFWEKSEKLTPC